MQTNNFIRFLDSLVLLNSKQLKCLKESISEIDSKKKVSMLLETPIEELICPYCKSRKFQLWGKQNDMQRYKCNFCNKTFNSLTGTPLSGLRRKGHWLDYALCLKKAYSIRRSASVCGISKSTSFRWRHRFLFLAKSIKPKKINGIIETQETYLLENLKGSRSLGRPARKRAGIIDFTGNSPGHICFLVSRNRNKNTFDLILKKINADVLSEKLFPVLSRDSLFCSDRKDMFLNFARNKKVRHAYIDFTNGELVKKDIVHLNNVDAYHYEFRKWMKRFNGVATKYLDTYVSWFRELDEFDMEIDHILVLKRAKRIF